MSVGAVRGRRLGEAEFLPWTSFHSCPSSAEGTALGPVTDLYGHRVCNLPATAAGTGKHQGYIPGKAVTMKTRDLMRLGWGQNSEDFARNQKIKSREKEVNTLS